MRNCTRLLVAGLAAWALSTGPAWGNIVNGDFATGDLTGWFGFAESRPIHDPAEASVGVVGEQLQMHVSKSYVSGSGGLPQLGDESTALVIQNVFDAGGFVPSGADALRFDADVEITGNHNVDAFARVQVTYSTASGELVESWDTVVSTSGMHTINLPGLAETGPALQVYLQTYCTLFPVPDPDTNYDVAVDATFDNFEFVKGDAGVIPEPLTIFSAMLAVGGLGAYIRRRNASAS